MSALARASWLLVQAAWGLAVLPWLAVARRGQPLAFTHHQDRDARGRDRQLGPLLDALGPRRLEIAFIPGTAAATLARLRPGAGLCVPYALIAVLGRLAAPFARDRGARLRARARVARWLLAALRPGAVFVIDESGSGQPLVRAARALGIRSAGIQHGDFAKGRAPYDGSVARDVVPCDVLCVWSPWFQARLLAISTIYSPANTRVTGRLRDPVPPAASRNGGPLRVLALGEAGAESAPAIAPYLSALRAAAGIALDIQPHPAAAASPRDLAGALAACDVAVGMRSSALLEALWHDRPVVIAGAAPHDLADGGLLPRCTDPRALPAACRTAAADPARAAHARDLVWGGAPAVAVDAILAAGLIAEVCQAHLRH